MRFGFLSLNNAEGMRAEEHWCPTADIRRREDGLASPVSRKRAVSTEPTTPKALLRSGGRLDRPAQLVLWDQVPPSGSIEGDECRSCR
jgi:hypothetical protein